MSKEPTRKRKFTGYHATIMLVAFFAVVVSVNMLMASFAISTFGGTVVDNSYVASQKYNDWLEQARTQKSYGWVATDIERVADFAFIEIAEADGAAMQGATVNMVAEHPIGRTEAVPMKFHAVKPGYYQTDKPMPTGRWKLKITIEKDSKQMRLGQEIR